MSETTKIKIVVTSTFGTLSRGRHSARQEKGRGKAKEVIWAGKDARGNLVIDAPGVWCLHCTDGFKREGRAVLTVSEDGYWEMDGETKYFDVLED